MNDCITHATILLLERDQEFEYDRYPDELSEIYRILNRFPSN